MFLVFTVKFLDCVSSMHDLCPEVYGYCRRNNHGFSVQKRGGRDGLSSEFLYVNSKLLCSSTSLFWQSLISKTMSRVLFQILVPNFMVIINMNVRSMPKNVRTHCMEIRGSK